MTDLSSADVDDMILRKTVGGPSRFGEKTKEELAAEVRVVMHTKAYIGNSQRYTMQILR